MEIDGNGGGVQWLAQCSEEVSAGLFCRLSMLLRGYAAVRRFLGAGEAENPFRKAAKPLPGPAHHSLPINTYTTRRHHSHQYISHLRAAHTTPKFTGYTPHR